MADAAEDQRLDGEQAAAEILPEVYTDPRAWPRRSPHGFNPARTLQPTARARGLHALVGLHDPGWDGRRHFFGAAALAMRET